MYLYKSRLTTECSLKLAVVPSINSSAGEQWTCKALNMGMVQLLMSKMRFHTVTQMHVAFVYYKYMQIETIGGAP